MSKSYEPRELSIAFNEGHGDAWMGKPPRPAKNVPVSDQLHQKYREGYERGATARYYYDKGYKDGKNAT